jgi:Lon protease-like protein
VTEVLERFDDGRLNVAVEGGTRFRVVELTSGRSFYTARVEDLADEEAEPADPAGEERARTLFRELQSVAGTDLDEPAEDAEPLSFAIASLLDFGVEPKQELLELRSERERLLRLGKLLENGIVQLRAARERADLASRNGRPSRS